MRARVGDLAIVRFDPDGFPGFNKNGNYEEGIGLVTGTEEYRTETGYKREYKVLCWINAGKRIETWTTNMPPSRLIRAIPKMANWEGTLHSLTRDSVIPR